MGRYAQKTKVPTNRSRDEIERVLVRYGATSFVYGWEGDAAVIGFTMEGVRIRLQVTMPGPEEFAHDKRGRRRTKSAVEQSVSQAQRQRWRALKLVVQAKLEAVDSGISTVKDEFLAFIVLPGGLRVRDHALPAVAETYETGKVVGLLPATTTGGGG